MTAASLEYKATLAGIVLLATFATGWYCSEHYNEPAHIAVTSHVQIRQADGSLIAARIAAQQAPQQAIPTGDKVTATGSVMLAAKAAVVRQNVHLETATDSGLALTDNGDGSYSATPALLNACQRIMSCPAQRLDLTTVVDKSGQQDLIVSSPDGKVDTATFAPAPLAVPKAHPWAVGLLYGASNRGMYLSRDLGPIRLSIDAIDGNKGAIDVVGLGWRF